MSKVVRLDENDAITQMCHEVIIIDVVVGLETLVPTCVSTCRHNAESQLKICHRHENL